MAAGYLVIKAPIKSLVQQRGCRLPADRTRWSAWYVLPHSFSHICASNYSLDVKHAQMSHLEGGYTLPAHFEGNLFLPFSSSSFSTWGVQMNNGLAMGQPEPQDMSERKIGSEKEGTQIQHEWGSQEKEEQTVVKELLFPSVSLCGQHIIKPKLTHLSWNINIWISIMLDVNSSL